MSENILNTLGKLLLVHKTNPGISYLGATIIHKLARSETQQVSSCNLKVRQFSLEQSTISELWLQEQ